MFRTSVQNSAGGGFDVVIIGGGMAGMATALRLQAAGLSTVVFEAHGHAGGCAGYFRHRGFSFDVGATTLVDFEPGGVGGEFVEAVGLTGRLDGERQAGENAVGRFDDERLPGGSAVGRFDGEQLPGYLAWLPDRVVTLHRDPLLWHRERLATLGDTPAHRDFWALIDRLADVFWAASRNGVKLPIRSTHDAVRAVKAMGAANLPLARYLTWTLGDALRRFGLRDQDSLVNLLGMLVEDTVHSTVDKAPLINAALGVTIRGAGLTRHRGGMHGFWKLAVARYRELGGVFQAGCAVQRVEPGFAVVTKRGSVQAKQVVSSLPIEMTAKICPMTTDRLRRYVKRDKPDMGGAVVVFLGVPEHEVEGQEFTHHQLLGDGKRNMFVSVSSPGDLASAPAGHRAVMISTHTELEGWDGPDYEQRKKEIGEDLVRYAQRVYPRLGERAVVYDVGTPRSYERFTWRPRGAVAGVRQTLRNTNQWAVPHDIGVDGLWLVGDTTWPGLGTVACVLGSRIVAEGVLRK